MAKTKTVYINTYVKDWRFAGEEIEDLGKKLDASREALLRCEEGTWAYNFWSTQSQRLMNKWKLAVLLKDTGLKQEGTMRDGITRRYDWWEGSDEPAGGSSMFWHWLGEKITGGPNLERAWAMAQKEKLQKARQGLA